MNQPPNGYNRCPLPPSLRLTLLAFASSLLQAHAGAESIRNTVRNHVKSGLEKPRQEERPKPPSTRSPDRPENERASSQKQAAPKAERLAPVATTEDHPPQQAAPAEPSASKGLAPSTQSTTPASAPPAAQPATKPAATAPAAAHRPRSGSGVVFQWSSFGEPQEPEPVPVGPPIPQRVFGTSLRLDPKAGGGLRGWIPEQYPTVETSADTYYTWSLDVSGSFFRYINLHRGYYESNGISGPRHQGAAVAAEAAGYAKKAAWLLGVIGVPITKAWEPVIRYESRAFQTRAVPRQAVRIVPFNTSPDADLSTIPLTTNPLTMVSGFETFVIAMRYNQSGEPATVGQRRNALPPFYFGLGFTQYSKPYQVNVGDSVLDSVLFDARFRGAGIAFGFTLPSKPDSLILDASVQLGLGEVRLLDKLTLNELLPNASGRSGLKAPEWVIGYLEGDLSVGYLYTLLRTKPSVLVSAVANGGGARFAYIKTRSGEGESVNMPSLNWDFLWGLMGYVTVPL